MIYQLPVLCKCCLIWLLWHDCVQLKWKNDAGSILINDTRYDLIQLHWHSPSEHTIDGRRWVFFLFCLFIQYFERIDAEKLNFEEKRFEI